MRPLILLGLVCAISTFATANEGSILSVDWPNLDLSSSATLQPRAVIENTGATPTSYYIQFGVWNEGDGWRYSACWPTGTLEPGEDKIVYPYSITVPKGAYKGQVNLFSDYCRTSVDTIESKTRE